MRQVRRVSHEPTKEELKKLPEEIQFFHKCPYFLKSKCASYHWNNDSPCWDCWNKKQYILRTTNKER